MLTRSLLRGYHRVSRSAGSYNSSTFVARSINGQSARGYRTFARDDFTTEWDKPHKKEVVKALTLSTIVESTHPSRVSPAIPPYVPPGKEVHPSIVLVHGATYGRPCQVDKIFATCPDHLILMRAAIGTARNPAPGPLKACHAIAIQLGAELSKLSPQARASLFRIGAVIAESRSKDVLVENPKELLDILQNPASVPPQKLLRVLEVALSPLGMIANSYGSPYCKIAKAKKDGESVLELERFMEKSMMPSLSQFYIPYIKQPGSPFAHLQMQVYAQGADISPEELVTISHYLECCSKKADPLPDIPQLRSVKVYDKSGRTLDVHDSHNLPHFFDVSGTTGAVMQAALGLLHMCGKSQLVDGPQATTDLGMLLAGCNFYKQGYHNFYEVLPALQWVNHHVHNVPYIQHTPGQLVHEVPEAVTRCVDPKSDMAPKVSKAMELVTEHAELCDKLAKKHLKQEMAKEQTPPTPTLGGTEG